jgi:mono/diheme cytochrome c family protein
MRSTPAIFIFLSGLLLAEASAITPQEAEFFEQNVRPVLVESCIKCHGPDKQKAELRVDSRAALLKGSDLGPVVVPGKPDEGSFIKSIRHEGDSKMPEKADKLPDAQIAALTEWVRMGMPWPEHAPAMLSAQEQAAKTHWAFQPIKNPAVPAVGAQKAVVKNEIDAFLLAKLEAQGLQMSPAVSRRTLIRRATFDLTGLPPTAAEIEAFEKDTAPDAWTKVLDRLLASPRYGERWGRYWLDVARYADTKGYLAGGEERRYAFSYTYRDWVIRALNEDLPYDQFLIRQIAADQVAPKDDPSSLAAMGFLTLGRRFLNNQNDIIDDRIDVVCRGTMGLTVVCARCHDHKFDPIPQKDYYALYGVFASSQEPKDLPPLKAEPDPEADAQYQKEYAEKQGKVNEELQTQTRLLAWRVATTTGKLVPIQYKSIDRLLDRAGKADLRKVVAKVDALNAGPLAPPHAMVMTDAPKPMEPRVFIRGNPGRPGEAVPRRFLTVLSGGDPKPFKNGSGRLELAQSIASKDNPLTARVIVNRVWNLHFGAGIVRTPGDFGVKGEPPTNPELLDWLATRFMAEGWSLKKLHRLMMSSAAYQQSSEATEGKAKAADPENRLLWRMNRRRLDFEATRDSLLFASGQLDLKMGGRAVDVTTQPFAKRRTVYGFIDRQNLPGVFRTFDFASPDTTSPQRFQTTVPQQALFMLNSPFVVEQTRALATKIQSPPQATEAEIQSLYSQIYARRAEPAEVGTGIRFVQTQLAQPPTAPEPPMWQYGYGKYDAGNRKVGFTALPKFVNRVWQGGAKLPDPKLGYVSLHAHGGHPGDADFAAIRRWTAPRDGTVAITGQIKREAKQGDGVIGRIVSSRMGELLQISVEPGATAEAAVAKVEVKGGETIDFLVEARKETSFDGFAWTPVLMGDIGNFDANIGFSGPPPPRIPPLTPWEKYVQVLLAANEFVFVD